MGRFSGNALEAIRIVMFSMVAAVVYGVIHDQISAHVCVEYFLIAHPPVFHTTSPFLLGLGWGVIATWWVGLVLGAGLLAAARLGAAPKVGLAQLRGSIIKLMAWSGLSALVGGLLGASLVANGHMGVLGEWAALVPAHKRAAFAAVASAHLASYASAFIGGLLLIAGTARRRFLLWRD